jgi:rhodanese-related sulfurtransferase
VADHRAKAALYDTLADAAKALANGRRAELVDVLAQGERSVDELADEIGQSVANTSQHLQRLLRSGLVNARREGTRIHYSLSSPIVQTLWQTMRLAAEEHATGLQRLADDYLGDRSKLLNVTRDQLRSRLRDGDVVVLDVRPQAEYAAGHIRGAVSIPIQDLKTRLGEIPNGADVVAYCRGPYCVYADYAVRLLSKNGITSARLEDGYPEWASNGLPVEEGEHTISRGMSIGTRGPLGAGLPTDGNR